MPEQELEHFVCDRALQQSLDISLNVQMALLGLHYLKGDMLMNYMIPEAHY